MKLPIVAYGDPVLKKKCTEIDQNYPDLSALIANMFETMYHASGVGLAAPQIGLPIRLFVIDTQSDEEKDRFKKVFINAEILEETGEAEYRIDRMMSQLALSGVLSKVAGVVFGQCTRCGGNIPGYIGFTVPRILHDYLSPLGVPSFHGANIGHIANQLSLPVGVEVEINAGAGSIRVLETVVA